MNTARKGRRLEHRSRALLEAAGYAVVRIAASRGPADLIAFNAAEALFVQVKAGAWPSARERTAFAALLVPPGARKLLHRWLPRQAQPDTEEV